MKKPFYKVLYIQVLIAVIIGVLLGYFDQQHAIAMKPLGDGFLKLIKMIIAPVIFCTVVSGIAGIDNMKRMGRVGGKALVYFEVVSTLALIIGLIVANTVRPGAGMDKIPSATEMADAAKLVGKAKELNSVDFFLNIIPKTMVDAFAQQDILPVLFVAILFGLALAALGERGKNIKLLIDDLTPVIFGIVNLIMKVAPIGAFGAMAFTIGKYGIGSLKQLGLIIGSFYLTAIVFVVVVLGLIARVTGFSIFKFLAYIKDELLLVLGTSSSESALANLMSKLERMGCSKSVVGLVVPTGYSFNLDGTNIFMTMGALFVAQAANVDLSLAQQLTIVGVAMVTSKGASGVSGSGLVILAATMETFPNVPAAVGLGLLLGIDKFMSECRALTNIIGNGVATVVVSAWEGELDREQMRKTLSNEA